jgi:SAM-dependent methyltransferase
MYDLYDRYTSTISLIEDDPDHVKWSSSYFGAQFGKDLPTNKKASILEIGCGYGRYLAALRNMHYENSYGIDISEQQVTYAREKLNLENIERADALKWLEGKESKYDCILLFDVLEHLGNDDLMTLGEKVYKALLPGGKLIIQVPNGMAPLSPFLWGDLTHKRAFTVSSMGQYLRNVGFSNFAFFELAPHIFTCKDFFRKIAWHILYRPMIVAFMMIANGGLMGGVFTANLKTIAIKGKP